MEIHYFNRSKSDRYSIEKVSNSIAEELSKHHRVTSFSVPYHKLTIINAIRNCLYVYKNRTKNGVNHITGDIHYCILGLIGCKSVLTIHDLVFLHDRSSKIKYFINYLFWLWLPVKLATKIVCISESTRDDLNLHIKTDKVSVIYDPVEMKVDPNNFICFNEKYPRILHIGTKPNKNLMRTIEGLEGVNCRLIIIGKLSDDNLKVLKNKGLTFENKYNLTEEELINEYEQADILSFISTFEGFGMPIVEGQLANCIVVTSNIRPMTEVGGDAAFYVNPFDVQEIHNGFIRVISDDKLRASLLANNKINAERFRPHTIAVQYENLYKQI